jgi:very-long-chain enoyl-CoA reductase
MSTIIFILESKTLNDDVKLSTLDLKQGKILYFKDLGMQIGWKTVFLWEYFGPLVCYLVSYIRPALIYGAKAGTPIHPVVQ